MTINTKAHNFIFYIDSPTEYTGVPKAKNTITSFDLTADLLSVRRLDGESLADFKQRMMDAAVHPDGGTYYGVINGITRDLGYSRNPAIEIDLKLDSSGEPIARNPRVEIFANKVVLYSDHRPDGTETIDKTVRIYQPDDEGYFLEDLVSEINTSDCFSASIYSDIRPNMHSTNLIRGDSDVFVQGDPIRTDSITYLSATNIVEGSVIFDNTDIFDTEVSGTPAAEGEYRLDRINGRLYCYLTPSGNTGITYHAAIFPYKVDYSPVKIYTLQDDNFQYELFNHETLDSGEETNALPNTEGSEIYHQLFKETKVFWGE